MLNMGKLWLEFQQSEFQKDLIDSVGKVNDSMAMFLKMEQYLNQRKMELQAASLANSC